MSELLLEVRPKGRRVFWASLANGIFALFLLTGGVSLALGVLGPKSGFEAAFLTVLSLFSGLYLSRICWFLVRNWVTGLSTIYYADKIRLETKKSVVEIPYSNIARISARGAGPSKLPIFPVEFADVRCYEKGGKRLTPLAVSLGSGVLWHEGVKMLEKLQELHPHLIIDKPQF